MQLDQLFPLRDLDRALQEGHVVRRFHPTEPLAILNYSDRCQWTPGLWTPVTRQCRGLIYRQDTLEVVARPFPKFFNYGQAEAAAIPLDAWCTVTDKLDGSLGILYPTSNGWAIATRGSFDSEQALRATAILRRKYPTFWIRPDFTALFEIIYPENRIVVDYKGQEDLVLLGMVDIGTGDQHVASNAFWPGPFVEYVNLTLADALRLPPRPNAEGLVVMSHTTGERLKIKQADYVRLHRIVTGLNERTVWEHLCAGKPIEELIEPLPDEFHAWVRDAADRLTALVEAQALVIERDYANVIHQLPGGFTRKDFALAVADHPQKWALFARHTGKDYRSTLWANAKPDPRSPRVFSEATA
jgi:RNA ligase